VTPFERLVRSLRMQVGQRYSTARMRLNPPELGEVRVDVHLRGDAVELEVRTTDEAARRIVAGRAEQLRSALEQGGVTVRRFDVMVDETMVATLPRAAGDSRAAGTSKRKSGTAEREAQDQVEVRRALSRRGRLDVRG
jgi:flagellar hook-length control protein FliK